MDILTRQFLEALQPHDVGVELTRVGPQGDGGYVVAKKIAACASELWCWGVGDDVRFEMDYDRRWAPDQIRLHDPTVSSLPVEMRSIAEFKGQSVESSFGGLPHNVFAKIDAEGGEWEALASANDQDLKACAQVVLEAHFVHAEPRPGLSSYFHQFYTERLGEVNKQLMGGYLHVLQRLAETHYLIHLHPNNSLPMIEILPGLWVPPLLELTYVRKDLVVLVSDRTPADYPMTDLDWPNKVDRPDVWFDFWQLEGRKRK